MVHFFPRLSASLTLGGLPAPVFILDARGSLVCPTASSAFPLPFPFPLAGVGAERGRKGADSAGDREKHTAGLSR